MNFGAGYSDHRHRWQLLLTSNLFRHGFSKTHMLLLYSKWFPTAVTLSFRPHGSVTTMQQSPFWETHNCWAVQRNPCFLWKNRGLLPCSQDTNYLCLQPDYFEYVKGSGPRGPDAPSPQAYTLNILGLQEEVAQMCMSEWGQSLAFTKNMGRGFLHPPTFPTQWTVLQS